MQSIAEIRSLLSSRGLRPKRALGQNFLHDHNQLRKLIEAAAIEPGELIVEVGPGTGTLTETLLEAGAQVIACELDDALAGLLRDRLGERITLVHGDCLQRGRALNDELVQVIAGRDFKLVANLPYQVASTLMTTLLIEHRNCSGQFVTIQKEVADRLLAPPGTKSYGPLGIIVQALAAVRLIAHVPPTCFWPQPDVMSAMVAVVPLGDQAMQLPGGSDAHAITARRSFARFVTELFMKRRKQLGSHVAGDALEQCGIEPATRPERLTIDQLLSLWKVTADVAGADDD